MFSVVLVVAYCVLNYSYGSYGHSVMPMSSRALSTPNTTYRDLPLVGPHPQGTATVAATVAARLAKHCHRAWAARQS